VLLLSSHNESCSPEAKVRAVAKTLGAAVRVVIIAGADHFFAGYEGPLAAAIAGALGLLASMGAAPCVACQTA